MRARIALVVLALTLSGCGKDSKSTAPTITPVTLIRYPSIGVGGDGITRGFYIPIYPGTSLETVTLWMSAATAGSHSFRLIARSEPALGFLTQARPGVRARLAGVRERALDARDVTGKGDPPSWPEHAEGGPPLAKPRDERTTPVAAHVRSAAVCGAEPDPHAVREKTNRPRTRTTPQTHRTGNREPGLPPLPVPAHARRRFHHPILRHQGVTALHAPVSKVSQHSFGLSHIWPRRQGQMEFLRQHARAGRGRLVAACTGSRTTVWSRRR